MENKPVGKYSKNWDQYYRRTYRFLGKQALWDVPPAEAAAIDIERFTSYCDFSIPVIDIGCGTGTQTAFLANHFSFALGVDVSKEAIAIANKSIQLDNARFGVMDITQTDQATTIHQELGDANVYIRGVLHQILEEDSQGFVEAIKLLIGTKGLFYFVEVADSIRTYFDGSSDAISQLPESIRNTFISNLPPRGVNRSKIVQLFPEKTFNILSLGETSLYTNIKFKNQTPICIPALFGIIKCQ